LIARGIVLSLDQDQSDLAGQVLRAIVTGPPASM
jgi:hypothetical protein